MSCTVTIVGVGLMGGSLGLALHDSPQVSRVVGVDQDADALQRAQAMGAIDQVAALSEGVKQADVLFLCAPLGCFPDLIAEVSRHVKPGTVVTDVGSTKEEVMSWMDQLPSGVWPIGGHPMAGSEITGILGADRYLFENAVYILTPGRDIPGSALALLTGLLGATGARIQIMDAGRHDRLVAAVSHIPHLAAVSLVNLTEGSPDLLLLAAGGFRDTTRVASSSPELWQGILTTNRQAVVDGLDQLIQQLNKIRHALNQEDSVALQQELVKAQWIRSQIPHGQKGLMPGLCDVICIVPDRPGVIGELGRVLGHHHINIADIEILRVREGDGGTIRLGLPSPQDGEKAVEVLRSQSIKAWIR